MSKVGWWMGRAWRSEGGSLWAAPEMSWGGGEVVVLLVARSLPRGWGNRYK